MEIVRQWYRRYFTDPQVIILALLLVAGFAVVLTFGEMLAPVLASVVIAYLLDGIVEKLQRWGANRLAAVLFVIVCLLAFLLFATLGLLPLLARQITQLFHQLPAMISKGQELLLALPDRYPNFISEQQVSNLTSAVGTELAGQGQNILTLFFPSLFGLITIVVYVVLMPVLVFFFLKDKDKIVSWFGGYLPTDRGLSTEVWRDVNSQIANYVRGKVWEIFVVGAITYSTFTLMGLQYSVLLATLVGLSVIIPYIGAAVVTLPIAVIAFFQWGWSADFGYILLAYGVIQALDGNVLVPLLFSEVVNLHPVAIIVAVLVFGGIWGFWGVFFAIPLATLVQAVLKAWPARHEHQAEDEVGEPVA